jgi:hypothetical protein
MAGTWESSSGGDASDEATDEAAGAGGAEGGAGAGGGRPRLTVGLVGFPNVGKSSVPPPPLVLSGHAASLAPY